ncbi:MAG: hypothetical protein ACOYVF_01980 [Candidatus Zixiibacteriota bacterium]
MTEKSNNLNDLGGSSPKKGNLSGAPWRSPHTFHIPVMGTGFTIDTPLKVARYGISSVMSIGDDVLIEQMRKYYCLKYERDYQELKASEEDYRARRITAYLNLVNELVSQQVGQLKAAPFEPGSEITHYFEMLPESPLKEAYRDMLAAANAKERRRRQEYLRDCIVPGSIDVNIMTKIDRNLYQHGKKLPPEYSVALSAMRGFARSSLRSAIVLSAGMNRKLFSYMSFFEDFYPDGEGHLNKKIIVKVSDYRSAEVQGKMLASRGLWVSEYRVESGLNCGGHAFATKGNLMGPILEEFRREKKNLTAEQFERCNHALKNQGRTVFTTLPEIRLSVQGGIGSAFEDGFLLKYFEVDATGWGTPFLLVPEVTNVDEEHLQKLAEADSATVFLSNNSPLGVPFWNLTTSSSEAVRRRRISEGCPGSPCPKGYLGIDTEFSDMPLCRASRVYQNLRLKKMDEDAAATPEHKAAEKEQITAKTCLCMDLAAGALKKIGADQETVTQMAVCCGPNIVNFKRTTTLEEMVSHIYGRLSLYNDDDRPNMFIRELELYIEYLKKELETTSRELLEKTSQYFREFKENLLSGAEYYQKMAEEFNQKRKEKFIRDLNHLRQEIDKLLVGLDPIPVIGAVG